jgi:hypothetical protein
MRDISPHAEADVKHSVSTGNEYSGNVHNQRVLDVFRLFLLFPAESDVNGNGFSKNPIFSDSSNAKT